MSEGPEGIADTVRVSVSSGPRRVDLVLPGSIPVAELVPELARSVGVLEAATAYAGYRLLAPGGRLLVGGSGLTDQGVLDGGLLTLTAGVDEERPRVYDDIVEAMADVVEHDLAPWPPAAGRRTALSGAGLSLALGAFTLGLQGRSQPTAAVAAVVAVLLVVAAVVLSRVHSEPEAAVCLAWLGAGYAAVAGLLVVDGSPALELGLELGAAGVGVLTAGLVAMLGIEEERPLVLPLVIVGGLLALSGLLTIITGWDAARVGVVTLALVVLAGGVAPRLALATTRTHGGEPASPDPVPIEPDRVRGDALEAHRILVACTAATGLLLVLVAPLAVRLGVGGTLFGVDCCLVVLLRTRQIRAAGEVRAGLLSGLAGLLSVTVAVLVLQPDWRPTTAVVLAAAGALLLVSTMVPSAPPLGRALLGDRVETVALVSLLPLTALALGVLPAIHG